MYLESEPKNNDIKKSVDKFHEDLNSGVNNNQQKNEFDMSLCYHLIKDTMTIEEMDKIFNQHIVNFNMYDKDPYQILFNPNLCFRNEDQFVEAKIFIPCILTQLIFNKEISNNGLMKIINTKFLPLNTSNSKISKIDNGSKQ